MKSPPIKQHFCRTLVLPPWSPGSLGDEYMVAAAAVLLQTAGEQAIVAEFPAYPGSRDRYSTVLPGLAGLGVAFAEIPHHDKAYLNDFDRAVLIGADTVDGVHSAEHSTRVLNGMAAIATTGRPVDVVSVSYSQQSDPSVDALIQKSGVRTWYARDLRSLARLRELGVTRAAWGGDLSLLANEAARHLSPSRTVARPPRPYVLVSIGPQTLRTSTLEEICDVLSSTFLENRPRAPLSLVAMPHDYRDFGGPTSRSVTTQLMAAMGARVGGDRLHLIEDRLTVPDMARLVRNALATVSGYMHLALFSSFNLTPSYFLAYHDKGLGQAMVNPLFNAGDLKGLRAFGDDLSRTHYLRALEQRVRLASQRRRARLQLFGGVD